MGGMINEKLITTKYRMLRSSFTERTRRLWAATEARTAGRGGFAAVVRATGISPTTLAKAGRELGERHPLPSERVRHAGGGRKRMESLIPDILSKLELLVEPTTRGDPESPLRWTCKSTRNLAEELRRQGYSMSYVTVARLLAEADYSLQGNRKTMEGSGHPDRNAQFEYINARSAQQLKRDQPVISVDTKKKELVGAFKNAGREWRPRGEPEAVRVHDFIDPEQGKAIPYGVYEVQRNVGWVSVGVTHDTSAFAVETICKWWRYMGKKAYPNASSLLITADSGGSNGARVRLWKLELQRFSNKTGLIIHVCHFPPGTSKWNKIEHRLFSFITQNWRGKPLHTRAAIVNMIAGTRTKAGLKVRCVLDTHHYPKAIKVSNAQMQQLRISPHDFHGDWNYTIAPNV
jgi:hypothetical protein